ncbi:hypothetical protein [Natronorubrum sp. DTA28]|uniref:hypothetical protein n=1 Tax=Natronorubrum sp. DTA28 TaxID=3447019 RepID=UPI003F85B87F
MIGTGSIGAAAIGGAVLMSGSAVAEVGDHTFSAETIEGTSDDGSIDKIKVWADNVEFSYEGLNDPAVEATVELQAVDPDGNAEAIGGDDGRHTTASIGGQSQNNVSLDETLEGDVLDHSGISADHFEEDGNGESNTTEDVDLRLEVTVTTNADDNVVGDTDADLEVIMNNLHQDADVGSDTDASGEIVSSEHIGTSPNNESGNGDDADQEGVLSVYGRHDEDERVFTVELEEPWSDEKEDDANLGLGFDVNQGGTWDFQVNWSSEEGFFSENEERDDFDEVPEFDGTKDGETLVFYVDDDEFDGDTFDFVANSSYGGHTHANVSADGENAWSPGEDFTSSEFFITVDVSETEVDEYDG